MGVVDELIRAREALTAANGWRPTTGHPLPPRDVLRPTISTNLATAAYLLGRRNDCVQALQRAYSSISTRVTRLPRCAARSCWPWCCSPAARRRSAAAGWVPGATTARRGDGSTSSSADTCSFTRCIGTSLPRVRCREPGRRHRSPTTDAGSAIPTCIAMGMCARGSAAAVRRTRPDGLAHARRVDGRRRRRRSVAHLRRKHLLHR